MKTYFVSGIGTDVGKTIASAVIVEALKADYWKPIQAGLEIQDAHTVADLISNDQTKILETAYNLNTPASPHLAAAIDGVAIRVPEIPVSSADYVVIEGAGGLLVPITDELTIADMAKEWDLEVILVMRHYLGSINHSLLSIDYLKRNGIKIKGLVVSGAPNEETERIVEKMGQVPIILRIPEFESLSSEAIKSFLENNDGLHSIR